MSVRGTNPTRAGVDLLPGLMLMIPGSIVVAALTTRLGRWRWAIWAGWSITLIGTGLMVRLDLATPYAVVAVTLAVFGIGSGMVLTSVNVGTQAISKVEDCAMAASMYGFFRSLGMPLGVSVGGTVFQNAMQSKLASHGLPGAIAHDSERYIYVLRSMAADDPRRMLVLDAYMHGFRGVFILMTCVAASALAVSLFIRRFAMDKKLADNRFQAR